MKGNNLFNYATSELSQDAFICWFLSWAKPEFKSSHKQLHNLSKELLKTFFQMCNMPYQMNIQKVDICKQYKNIDILLKINDTIAIIIEDKVKSVEHSNQLIRYKELLNSEGFKDESLITIYLQTGEQGDYSKVKDAGYKHFSRGDFLKILRKNRNISNDIFLDFLEYLESIEEQFSSYQVLRLSKWNGYSWQGFYKYLQNNLGNGNWGFVPNARGGFFGFWWYLSEDKDCKQYFQLEEQKLCYKISVEGSEKINDQRWKKELQNYWHQLISESSVTSPLSIKKPRFRTGTWMTVAVLDGDYRKIDDKGIIDLEQTLNVIHQAKDLLYNAINLR